MGKEKLYCHAEPVEVDSLMGKNVTSKSLFDKLRVTDLMLNIKSILLILLIFSIAQSAVKLPAIISDNMVLQNGENIRIWGWANPGEKITVKIADQSKTVKTSKDSSWMVMLDKIPSGQTYVMTVSGENTVTVSNILIGELWVCGGQSNMRWHVKDSDGAEDALQYADYPEIRLFTVEPQATALSQKDCEGKWTVVSPNEKELANFSAVGYFFGRKLHRELGVPVGLIDNSWGGTPIEAWMSSEAMLSSPDFKFYLDQRDEWLAHLEENQKKFDTEEMNPWQKLADEAKANGESLPTKPRVPNWLRPQRLPSYLYNGMVVPIAPLVIKGVIWYQGEANVTHPHLYQSMFETLIYDWRKTWNIEDMPFYYAQLSMRQTATPDEPEYSDYGFLREAQTNVMALPNTGMAVTIDVGDVGTIHPTNKLDVGLRLARWALKNDFGYKDLDVSGPIYKSMTIDGNKIIISFDENTKGLKMAHGELKQIAIAGKDQKFVWAQAKTRGNQLIVWHENIKNPVAVRYAWADVPMNANLYGKNGLPASPFRTDNWEK